MDNINKIEYIGPIYQPANTSVGLNFLDQSLFLIPGHLLVPDCDPLLFIFRVWMWSPDPTLLTAVPPGLVLAWSMFLKGPSWSSLWTTSLIPWSTTFLSAMNLRWDVSCTLDSRSDLKASQSSQKPQSRMSWNRTRCDFSQDNALFHFTVMYVCSCLTNGRRFWWQWWGLDQSQLTAAV